MRGSDEAKPDLTERQLQIVVLIARGCSNDEVGERLGISPRTAKAHCDVLRQKLGVPRRRQIPAAVKALTGEDPLPRGLAAGPAGAGGRRRTPRPGATPGPGPPLADGRLKRSRVLESRAPSGPGRGMTETITATASPALDHIIERPRLIARLEEGGGARVTVLAAPAGYGKTTLARQ